MDIHGQIMNLPAQLPRDCAKMASATAYKAGHRDARHAAAELAQKLDVVVHAAQAVLAWRHDSPTTGYLRDNDSSRKALRDLSEALAALQAPGDNEGALESAPMTVKVDGFAFNLDQVCGLASQSLSVLLAYEKASPDNGGGESVDWDDLDPVDERIRELVGEEVVAAVAKIAQSSNGYTPDEEMQGNGDAQ